MPSPKHSVGIQAQLNQEQFNSDMAGTGKIIRDAWVFGVIPERESCDGWTAHELEQLAQKVDGEWKKYDFDAANLPPHIRTHFDRIYGAEALEEDR